MKGSRQDWMEMVRVCSLVAMMEVKMVGMMVKMKVATKVLE